jgi:transposase
MNMDYVGIDVSKHHLDLALGEAGVVRVANNAEGIARLIEQVSGLSRPHVVCEATGSHTRQLSRELSERGIAFSRVNPRRVRELARADGQRPRPMRLTPG